MALYEKKKNVALYESSLIKCKEGKSTSGLCFSTLAQDKGVGDERCDLPLSTRS